MDALSPKRLWKVTRAALVLTLLGGVAIVAATRTNASPPNGIGDLDRVSLSAANGQLATGATQPAISGDGRYVAFTTAENSAASTAYRSLWVAKNRCTASNTRGRQYVMRSSKWV